MAETARPRPIEYQSPRILILGLCFFWGMGVGFALNFVRPSESSGQRADGVAVQTLPAGDSAKTPAEPDRRRQDAPDIAEVAPAPEPAPNIRPTLEDIETPIPSALLTTEGGLSGRTATLPGGRPARTPDLGVPPPSRPPPLPDLLP